MNVNGVDANVSRFGDGILSISHKVAQTSTSDLHSRVEWYCLSNVAHKSGRIENMENTWGCNFEFSEELWQKEARFLANYYR